MSHKGTLKIDEDFIRLSGEKRESLFLSLFWWLSGIKGYPTDESRGELTLNAFGKRRTYRLRAALLLCGLKINIALCNTLGGVPVTHTHLH